MCEILSASSPVCDRVCVCVCVSAIMCFNSPGCANWGSGWAERGARNWELNLHTAVVHLGGDGKVGGAEVS